MSSYLSPLSAFQTAMQTQAASTPTPPTVDSAPDFTALISGPATYGMALLLISASIAVLIELRLERSER